MKETVTIVGLLLCIYAGNVAANIGNDAFYQTKLCIIDDTLPAAFDECMTEANKLINQKKTLAWIAGIVGGLLVIGGGLSWLGEEK